MTDLSPDDLKLREGATRREYPEMVKAFDEARAVMVAAIIDSGTAETEKRERLYRSIRTLDDVQKLMTSHLGSDSEAIAGWLKSLEAPEE